MITNEKKYEILKDVVDSYHSSIDRRQVIGKVMEHIERELSPVDIYIYGDNSFMSGFPMKNLYYTNILDEKREILLRGKIRKFDDKTFFPLKGLHGTYGLFEVKKKLNGDLISFLSTIISLAGNAIESIHLKDTSDEVIRIFQKINQICFGLSEKNNKLQVKEYLVMQLKELLSADDVHLYINTKAFLGKQPDYYGKRKYDSNWLSNWIKRIDKRNDSIIINDIENSKIGPEEFKSGLGVPFVRNRKIVGYCIIFSKNKGHFKWEDLRLVNSIIHYASLIFYNVSLLENLQERVLKDELTKLFNRSYIEDFISTSLDTDERGSFLVLDIDDFKKVNDTLGHRQGDIILIQVANTIKRGIRTCDVAARWGGEELVVYLPGIPGSEGKIIADRLVKSIKESTSPRVTVSCGVSYWEGRGISYKDLFSQADKMLYVAKSQGKNKAIIGDRTEGEGYVNEKKVN